MSFALFLLKILYICGKLANAITLPETVANIDSIVIRTQKFARVINFWFQYSLDTNFLKYKVWQRTDKKPLYTC